MDNPTDTNELLKNLASESVKQGENLRVKVRELTLNALRARELSLTEVKQVLNSVTEGINLGAAKGKLDSPKVLEDALAGMDDALLKAAQANHIALKQLASAGQSFSEQHMKSALDDLERLEDAFLKTVKEAAGRGSEQLKQQWAGVLQRRETAGTETGGQIAATMEEFGARMQSTLREQRRAMLKTAQVLTDNFATLASGILTGLTEGLQQSKGSTAHGTKKEGPGKTDKA